LEKQKRLGIPHLRSRQLMPKILDRALTHTNLLVLFRESAALSDAVRPAILSQIEVNLFGGAVRIGPDAANLLGAPISRPASSSASCLAVAVKSPSSSTPAITSVSGSAPAPASSHSDAQFL
jgi:hypothetical protein